jgi:hypothetical protein
MRGAPPRRGIPIPFGGADRCIRRPYHISRDRRAIVAATSDAGVGRLNR